MFKSAANKSGGDHGQHVVCFMILRDSSAIEFDRAEITFFFGGGGGGCCFLFFA